MKAVVILLALTPIFSTFSGGISVGSGRGKIVVGLSVEEDFKKESQIMHYTQELIREISNGKNERLNSMIKTGQCALNHRAIDQFDITSYYPVAKNGLTLQKIYVGYLTVELKDCKRADQIVDEPRFGWSELWD